MTAAGERKGLSNSLFDGTLFIKKNDRDYEKLGDGGIVASALVRQDTLVAVATNVYGQWISVVTLYEYKNEELHYLTEETLRFKELVEHMRFVKGAFLAVATSWKQVLIKSTIGAMQTLKTIEFQSRLTSMYYSSDDHFYGKEDSSWTTVDNELKIPYNRESLTPNDIPVKYIIDCTAEEQDEEERQHLANALEFCKNRIDIESESNVMTLVSQQKEKKCKEVKIVEAMRAIAYFRNSKESPFCILL